ncbi:MOSC domain-containing protein [Planctomycetota bacterium]
MANIKGRIKAISISEEKGTRKHNVGGAELKINSGLTGDAHAGNWHRQVSLLAWESIEKMRAKGPDLKTGDFAENITTEGIDLQALNLGSKIRLGPIAEIQVTQFGKQCNHKCEILKLVGQCIMPKEGIFAKVIKPGRIQTNDSMEVIDD